MGDTLREVSITHFSGPRIKPWARMGIDSSNSRSSAKGGPLTASGVAQLLQEDDASFDRRFPENPRLPSTGGTHRNAKGYPTVVVTLVNVWKHALGDVTNYLH